MNAQISKGSYFLTFTHNHNIKQLFYMEKAVEKIKPKNTFSRNM